MIVVTGFGRSWTSAVAALYRELGFDPGGEWYPEVNAGLEDHQIVRLNERLIRALGVGVPERELPGWVQRAAARMPRLWKQRKRILGMNEIFGRGFQVRWNRFDRAVGRHGAALREAAAARKVAKDPRFGWTIGAWVAAGAPIEHVIFCTRNLEAVLESRRRARSHIDVDRARNTLLYRLGLTLQSLAEHEIDHDVVRFPGFVQDPEVLWKAMRFPEPVRRRDFDRAFARVMSRDSVHDWR